MEFATRDRYRHVVERMARASPLSEGEVARQAVGLAREAPAGDARASHVGFYLVDKGVRAARAGGPGAAFGPDAPAEAGPAVRPAAVYRRDRDARRHRRRGPRGKGACRRGARRAAGGGGLLSILAASQLAVALANWLAVRLVAPQPLPRLDFSTGIPAGSRTLVVVPTMLASASAVEELVEALEVRFLANRDGNLQFGLLTDFRDADEETLPGDLPLALLARTRIEELDRKYGGGTFFLFHRPRSWNPQERCWMGYERKRGKLAALNALLRGGPGDAFALVVGRHRDARAA